MWFVVAGVALFAAGMTAEYLIERAGRARARFDAQIAAFEKRIERNRAPKHAARSPRERPGGVMVPGENPGQVRAYPEKQHPPAVRHTAAEHIAPVFLPAPGVSIPLRPQPGRDSGAGTGTLPRLTDTGGWRAAMDDFIARMERDGERYREELTS